jgi:phage gp16-like protein
VSSSEGFKNQRTQQHFVHPQSVVCNNQNFIFKKMKKQLLIIISVLLTIQSMAQVNFIERVGNESLK